MKRLLLLLFLCTLSLYASECDSLGTQEASIAFESEPSSFVNNVNVISGTYHHSSLDLTIPGQEALDLKHSYSSDCFFDNWMGKVALSTNFPTRVIYSGLGNSTTAKHLSAEGTLGSFLHYKSKEGSGEKPERLFFLAPKTIHKGLANTGSGEISGRTNLKNSWFYFEGKESAEGFCKKGKLTAGFGDGMRREYHHLHLDGPGVTSLRHETRPNGTRLCFDYHKSDDTLKAIYLFDRHRKEASSWLKFDYDEDHKTATVSASNGQSVEYSFFKKSIGKFGKMQYVYKIASSHNPTVHFDYTEVKEQQMISKISLPEGRFLEIDYDHKGRVKAQRGPLGKLWNFYYHDYQTEALDALRHKTLYHYSTKDRLTIIDRYESKKLLRRERFFWGDRSSFKDGHKDESNEGNLIGKALMDKEDKALVALTNHYDSCGNILHETLHGNLTGSAHRSFSIDEEGRPTSASESYKRYFTYSKDDFNLTLSESADDGIKTVYEYKQGSNLLAAKFVYDGNRIAIREFYEYDKNATLIEQITDDGDSHDRENLHGITERRITKIVPVDIKGCLGVGQPETITEYCYDLKNQKRIQLKRREFRYNTEGLVTVERVYDAHDIFAFELSFEYDSKGRLIRTVDALKQEQKFKYDENNNKIYEELVDSGVATTFLYDKMNRLIEKIEKHADGEKLKEIYSYDLVGNKISSTDSFGHETRYEYDDLNRLVTIVLPKAHTSRPTITREYDEMNNVIAETNQNGATTHTSYNSRRQPTSIRYADGSEESMRYNLDGTLKYRKEKNGTSHHFEYDYQKRVTKEIIRDAKGSYLSSTSNFYNAFHLLATEDAMHYRTDYSYDAASRLKEVRKEQSRVTYEYDAMGREVVTKDWNGPHRYTKTIKEFDLLNRLIEERQEHDSGTLLNKRTFAYDRRNNQTRVTTYSNPKESTTVETKYNSRNLPTTITDELGAVTTIEYDLHFRNSHDERVLRRITTDALGNRLIEIHDLYKCPVDSYQENKKGECTQRAHLRYDGVGNVIQEIHEAIKDYKSSDSFRIVTKYDALNRMIQLTEQSGTTEEKKTKYSYSKEGFLETLIKPDGIILTHTYDALGNLQTLISSDKTISYEYSYDKNSNPITVVDHVHHVTHKRSFDAHGKVTKDFDISLAYDKRQRLKLLTLPDGSSVRYRYVGGHLSDVVRYSPAKKALYRHSYNSFDLEDHVLKGTLIGKAGTVDYSWDKKGRCVALTTPHWHQELTSIDAADNLKKMTIIDPIDTLNYHFSYDDLYQLKKENDHTYEHDSLCNRLKKDDEAYTVDLGNKLRRTPTANYSYDKNGNLISKTENDLTTHFRYDALNRLIEASQDEKFLVCYTYDSLHRRLSKQTHSWHKGKWQKEQKLNFLYLAEREIGALDAQGNLVEFRALGRGKGSDIGASVSIELAGTAYSPIHDHRGNITQLINAETGEVAETMRYTAFGEETVSKSLSPWRFASKRLDPETGFIYFGQRYYCPETGRWITPDPAGFSDGPNLYAYVQNNPLTLFDPYGLSFWDDAGGQISRSLHELREQISASFDDLVESTCNIGTSFIEGFFDYDTTYSAKDDIALDNKFAATIASQSNCPQEPLSEGNPIDITDSAQSLILQNYTRQYREYEATMFRWGGWLCGKFGSVFRQGFKQGFKHCIKQYSKNTCKPNVQKIKLGKSIPTVKGSDGIEYTRSNTKLGQELHKLYKAECANPANNLFKEYRLRNNSKVDFLDANKGIIYELKPNNPKSIMIGGKQAERYRQELIKDPRFSHIKDWNIQIEVY